MTSQLNSLIEPFRCKPYCQAQCLGCKLDTLEDTLLANLDEPAIEKNVLRLCTNTKTVQLAHYYGMIGIERFASRECLITIAVLSIDEPVTEAK